VDSAEQLDSDIHYLESSAQHRRVAADTFSQLRELSINFYGARCYGHAARIEKALSDLWSM
jgi:hypothetical protein